MADKRLFLGAGPRTPKIQHDQKDWSFTNHLSCSFGKIIPVFLAEMSGNEFFWCKPVADFDLMPMVFPIQSTITMHLSFYGCAFRNLWKGWRDFESRVGNHKFPYIKRSEYFHGTRSLLDYMGVPSYVNRPSIDWLSVRLFSSSNNDVNMLRRGFFTEPDTWYIGNSDDGNGYHYRVSGGDSLYHWFSVQPSDSKLSRPCQLQDFLRLPISVSQPWIKFQIVTQDKDLDLNFSALSLGAVSYTSKDTDGSSTYEVLAPSSYLRGAPQPNFNTIAPGSFSLIESRDVDVGISHFRLYTFGLCLTPEYLYAINKRFAEGWSVRLFFVWDSAFNVQLGNNTLTYVYPRVSVEGLLPKSQNIIFSNGHTQNVSSNFYFENSGLQGEIYVRSETSQNVSVNNSPFISVNGAEPKIPLSALPPRMYEMVYNVFFRNPQVDPFYKNGQPTYNEFLTNDGDGADSSTPLSFKYARYEDDFLTDAKFTPQAGNAPLVGISAMPGAGDAVFHFEDVETGTPYHLKVTLDDAQNITGISSYGTNANESTLKNLNALIQFGISINDFRSVSAFQRYCERHQRAGFDYKSIVKEFFGTNAPIGEELPRYLGGISQPVSIYKLENQSATDLPLGYFAGTGRVGTPKKFAPITCRSSERMLIMGLLWFTVTPVFPQKLDKFWTKSQLLDFYNPQFAAIGNQPIHNYEVAPLQAQNDDELFGVFGYQRPWYEYTMKQDEVHGEFRSTMHNYLLQREFATIPQLGPDFININPDDLTNIFSYTQGSDKIFGAIRFNARCNSVVPDFIQPTIVG